MHISLHLIYLWFCIKVGQPLNCTEFTYCSANPIGPTSESEKYTSNVPPFLEECNCNRNCYSFGDCCLDAPSVEANPLKYWSVLTVKVSPKFSYTVLMKTKCPIEWKNKKVREMCENIGFSEEEDFLLPEFGHYMSLKNDEFLLWHVTSKTTQITYRNIYCSHCNNDTDVESWEQRIRCLKTDNGEKCSPVYYSSPPEFIVQQKVSRKPIQIQISSMCNIGWYKTNIQINSTKTIDIIKNCALFYAPIVVYPKPDKLIAFKNKFCAICNDYKESQMICPKDSEREFQHQIPTLFNRYSQFDTNFISGGKIPKTNETCPPGSVYNPFANKCRLILISDENKISGEDEMLNDGNDSESDDENNSEVTNSTDEYENESSRPAQTEQLNENSVSFKTKSHLLMIFISISFVSYFSLYCN